MTHCIGDCHIYLPHFDICICGASRWNVQADTQVIPNYITITKLQGDTYVAYHPELPTVISQGDTPGEARANLVEATELAVNYLVNSRLALPVPMTMQAALDFDRDREFSWRMVVQFHNRWEAEMHVPNPHHPSYSQPQPAPEVPLSTFKAAQAAGATHLSADGSKAFRNDRGNPEIAHWDREMGRFDSWWATDEVPGDAVKLDS